MRLFTLLLCSLALCSLALCSLAYAQEFDVASIKVSAPLPTSGNFLMAGTSGGPGTNDPTHFTWPNATLRGILLRAYDVKFYQISAPEWLASERFDIAVVIPEGATKEQIAVMWRNLLVNRFGVKLRMEKKEFAVDELVVGPRGHKLQATANPNAEPLVLTGAGGGPFDKDGKLRGAALVTMLRSGANGVTAQLNGMAQTIEALAGMLSNSLNHPVLDKTGLGGKFDFVVDYAPTDMRLNGLTPPPPPGGAPTPASAPVTAELGLDLPTAIQQQLGLRLEKGKGMLDYIVVEKAERVPTEN